jgi:hypothetical protein
MPKIKPRKLSQGEQSELKRLQIAEALRLSKARTPLPGSKHYNGMPIKPPRFDYSQMNRLAEQ